MTKTRIQELADEAADCIETNQLNRDDLADYLAGFLKNVLDEAMSAPPAKVGKGKRKK